MHSHVESMHSLPFPPPLCPRQSHKPELSGKGQNKNCCWLLRWLFISETHCLVKTNGNLIKEEELFDWEVHGIPRPEIITVRTRCYRSFGEEITAGESLQSEMLHMQSPIWLGKSSPQENQFSKHHPHQHLFPILLGPMGDPEPLTADCPWWLSMFWVCANRSAQDPQVPEWFCVSMTKKAVIT